MVMWFCVGLGCLGQRTCLLGSPGACGVSRRSLALPGCRASPPGLVFDLGPQKIGDFLASESYTHLPGWGKAALVLQQAGVSVISSVFNCLDCESLAYLLISSPYFNLLQYDQYKTPMENIGLQDSLLSRFDLLFIVLDQMDPEQDREISDHVLRMHRYRNPNEQDGDGELPLVSASPGVRGFLCLWLLLFCLGRQETRPLF